MRFKNTRDIRFAFFDALIEAAAKNEREMLVSARYKSAFWLDDAGTFHRALVCPLITLSHSNSVYPLIIRVSIGTSSVPEDHRKRMLKGTILWDRWNKDQGVLCDYAYELTTLPQHLVDFAPFVYSVIRFWEDGADLIIDPPYTCRKDRREYGSYDWELSAWDINEFWHAKERRRRRHRINPNRR